MQQCVTARVFDLHVITVITCLMMAFPQQSLSRRIYATYTRAALKSLLIIVIFQRHFEGIWSMSSAVEAGCSSDVPPLPNMNLIRQL